MARRCILTLLTCAAAIMGAHAETLHLYTWADYVCPDVVTKFEKQHHCEVVIDVFDSNESMYARLKAGATGYDLVVPTAYMIQVMQAQGMLARLDHRQLPNLKHIDPAVLSKVPDKSMLHSVPYTLAFSTLAVRRDRVKNAVPSWAMFDHTALSGRITLLDDMRESIGAALKFLGYSANTRNDSELAAAREVLIRWKRNLARFDNEGYKAGIDSAEYLLVQGYSGDLFQVHLENPQVVILLPQEGMILGCDEFVILNSAQQPTLAHAFIDFLLDPDIAAENMQWMGYYCPNKAALQKVDSQFLNNPAISMPADLLNRSEVLEDLGADLVKYVKVWEQVKAAR